MDSNLEYKPMDVATFDEKFARLRLRKKFREHIADLLRWLLAFIGAVTLMATATLVVMWHFCPHLLQDWIPRVVQVIRPDTQPASDDDVEQLEKKLAASELKRQILDLQVLRLQERINKLELENQRLKQKP